jgi:hypothetical protein
MGLVHTPTIVVVTAKEWIEVRDVDMLRDAIKTAELDTHLAIPPKPATTHKRPTS